METTTRTFTDAEVAYFKYLNKADSKSLNSGNKLRSALLQTMYSFESGYYWLGGDREATDLFIVERARERLSKFKLKNSVIEAIITLAQEKKDDKEYLERVKASLFTFIRVNLQYPGTRAYPSAKVK